MLGTEKAGERADYWWGPTRLLEVCAMLMNGRPGMNVTMATMARVPVALLSHFREIERGGTTSLTLKQLKGIMLMTIANVTHGLKGSNMLSQLALVPGFLPSIPARKEPPEIFGRVTSSSNPVPYIRLSRLLAHRHSLGQGEIDLLEEALGKVAAEVPAAELSLDPQHILLRLPGQRDMAQTARALDVRLDSVSGLTVMLESRAYQLRAQAKGLTLTFTPVEALPLILGEHNQLAQVVTNLVMNSLNYTNEGYIHIRTAYQVEMDRVMLEVRDTGSGILPEDRPHLLQRFYRGSQHRQGGIPGTGLGLAIVKEILDIHKGQIEVESEMNVGTIFRIYLSPYRKNETENSQKSLGQDKSVEAEGEEN